MSLRFDLTDLSLFRHVAEAGSITAGAARAHLALASASARLRGLEEGLGVALLERGRRGVRPTPAGRALLHHARTVLAQCDRLSGELAAYGTGIRGHVRLFANTAATSEFLPEALSRFLAAHPGIDIDLEERLSYEIVEAVAEGRVDLGIVADAVDRGDLEALPFRRDRLVVVVPRGHALAARRALSFAEILDAPLVGLTEGSALQDYLALHAARLGRRPTYRVRLRGFDAVCRMAERGVGLGVVPEAAARRCRRIMAIGAVRLSDAWAARRLLLVMRRLTELPLPARQLVEALAGDG